MCSTGGGGVLSPLLYSIYALDTTNSIPNETEILQFADDIVMFVKNSSSSEATKILEKSIEVLNSNLMDIGLELSSEKTKVVYFNKKISNRDLRR